MNPTQHLVSPPSRWPLPRFVIVLLCLVAPVLSGSVLYYLWIGRHPEAARFANRTSWIVFLVTLSIAVVARLLARSR